MSIAVDASCCPKSLLSFLIAFGFSRGIFKKLTLFYAHTNYDEKLSSDNSEQSSSGYRFTEGVWDAVQIPYLEGQYRPSSPRTLIVTMGAETPVTESFIKRYQPDYLKFVVPHPSVTPKMEMNVSREIESLIARFEMPETAVMRVGPHDAIGCVSALEEMLGERISSDLSIACLGTKPHAVAAALLSLQNPEVGIISRAPHKYVEYEGKPNGEAHVYEITDLSAI